MTTLVPRPATPRVITIRAAWRCECGRERNLVAANVRTDLPLDVAARPAGACRDCGTTRDHVRIDTTERAYRVHIERR